MGDCCDCLAVVLRLSCAHGNSAADLLEAMGTSLHGRPATKPHPADPTVIAPAPRVAPAPTPPRQRNVNRRVVEEVIIDESTISNITSEDCVSEGELESDTESVAFRPHRKATRDVTVQATPRAAAARKATVQAKVSTKKEKGLERIKALRESRRREGLKVKGC